MCRPVNRVFALTLTDQVRYTCDRVELGLIVIPTLARFPQCHMHQDGRRRIVRSVGCARKSVSTASLEF